jgi:two-component system response regulator HydG
LELLCYRTNAFADGGAIEALRPIATIASIAIANAGIRANVDRHAVSHPWTVAHKITLPLFNSTTMKQVVRAARTVKDSNCTVLITGETGTGKEVIARLIHYESKRRQFPFVDLNCSAIPEGLQESELFGIEKGVATGVDRHVGKLEVVGPGTLFLDEIGDMPGSMQVKMLRVLEERTFRRVGGHQGLQFNGRIVAATNRNILSDIADGRFREELYYRISVVQLHLPALRERIDDIPLLVRAFVASYCAEQNRAVLRISDSTMNQLCRQDWPGNIRELRNAVERAVLFSPGDELKVSEDVHPSLPQPRDSREAQSVIFNLAFEQRLSVPDLVGSYSRFVFERLGRKKTPACGFLGLNYRTLSKKLKTPNH